MLHRLLGLRGLIISKSVGVLQFLTMWKSGERYRFHCLLISDETAEVVLK
jgi:hypothetical protein